MKNTKRTDGRRVRGNRTARVTEDESPRQGTPVAAAKPAARCEQDPDREFEIDYCVSHMRLVWDCNRALEAALVEREATLEGAAKKGWAVSVYVNDATLRVLDREAELRGLSRSGLVKLIASLLGDGRLRIGGEVG